jgi:aminoglycoside phosphotransferase (APT) family kinase protein
MGGVGPNAVIELDEDQLALTAAELLAPALGRDARVESVRRERSPFATLFPADVLHVSLAGGRAVRVFLKHLGPEQPGQPDKERRDREVLVYEHLLRDERLPVPRCYGSRWNDRTGRRELYLEYLDDWNLKYHAVEQWFVAARRLAQLHAYFAGRTHLLRGCDFLLSLDRGYFTRWAGRARQAVAAQSAELDAPMEQILSACSRVAELLEQQPPTLVHNDLAPKNVIADRAGSPTRIFFIDWEMAGVGCGLLDLVHLKYGLDRVSEREMVAAYRAGLEGTGLLPLSDGEFERVLAACELHKTLYRLAHSPAWRLPPATLAQWVAEATAFLERV